MIKKRIATILACLTVFAACTSTPPPTESKTNIESSAKESRSGAADGEKGGRDNPADIGEDVEREIVSYDDNGKELVGDAVITVEKFVSGEEAASYLMNNGMENVAAPEGMQWAYVEVRYEIADSDKKDQYFLMSTFALQDENGEDVVQEMIPALSEEDSFANTEIEPGEVTVGKIAFAIPQNATKLTFELIDSFENKIFFKIR